MEVKEKIHWKKFFKSDYLSSGDVPPNQDLILTIKSVHYEDVKGEGGRVDKCVVIRFVENGYKPFIVNKTNNKTIAKIYNTPYVNEWSGKMIQIWVDGKVKYKGDLVEGLRIRPIVPKVKSDPIKQLMLKVNAAYSKYKGDDRDGIGKMIAEKKKAGEITEIFLNQILKDLSK